MSNSLRDQLVKAGLATSGQAKKAEKQQRSQEVSKRRSTAKGKSGKPGGEQAPTAKDNARRVQKEKTLRDKATAKTRNDKYAQHALRAEIRQIIKTNDQRKKAPDDDALAYNFVHGKRIKRIYVTKEQRDQLSSGRLIVINNDGNYHFVAPDIAKKIEERDPKRIIVAHDKAAVEESSEDDEYYSKFKVPDDLDW